MGRRKRSRYSFGTSRQRPTWFGAFASPKSQRTSHSRRLRIEPLEERRMLSAYLVNTELDSVDPNDGLTSLREAITIANAAPGADTINFDASLAGKTILLTQGELKITDDLTVNGLGAGLLTVDASGNDPTPGWNPLPDDDSDGDGSRVFNIPNAEFPRYSVVVLRGLTITGGDSKAGGGGIYSYADLTLIEVDPKNWTG